MKTRHLLTGWLMGLLLLPLPALIGGCKGGEGAEGGRSGAPDESSAGSVAAGQTVTLPEVDDSDLPLKLQMKIGAARREAERAPQDASKVSGLGALFHVHGFPEAAVTCFTRATTLEPEEFNWWYYLARAHERAGDAAQAIAAYEQALKLDPDYAPAHLRLAKLLSAQGRAEEAAQHQRQLSDTEEAILVNDAAEGGLLRRGFDLDVLLYDVHTLGTRGSFEQAEVLLREAQGIDESGVRARIARGQLWAMQGMNADAIGELRAVLSEQPGFLPAKTVLGLVLAQAGEHEEAERLLREVLEEQPATIDALDGLCRLMSYQGRPDEALPMLERARQAAPDNAELHYESGKLLADMGKTEKAIEVLRKAVELKPDYPKAHHLCGVLLRSQGDADGARREWTAALRVAPAHLDSRLALLGQAMADKDYAGAEKLMREGLEHMPRSPVLGSALAWILATCPDPEQRNAEEAIKRAEKACHLTEYSSFEIVDTLAAAYAEAGRFDDARKWIAQAIELAQAAQQPELVKEYQQRQKLYQQDQPYHEPQ